VTRRGRRRNGKSVDVHTLRVGGDVLRELEERLETSFIRFDLSGWLSGPLSAAEDEPCGCVGTLCNCDGQDCLGVCAAHCLLNYV